MKARRKFERPAPGSYAAKLQDPRWQRRRLSILERDDFTCQDCGATEKTLHVHHTEYTPGGDPWAASPMSLVTLCVDCHESEGNEAAAVNAWLVESLRANGFLNSHIIGLVVWLERYTGNQIPALLDRVREAESEHDDA